MWFVNSDKPNENLAYLLTKKWNSSQILRSKNNTNDSFSPHFSIKSRLANFVIEKEFLLPSVVISISSYWIFFSTPGDDKKKIWNTNLWKNSKIHLGTSVVFRKFNLNASPSSKIWRLLNEKRGEKRRKNKRRRTERLEIKKRFGLHPFVLVVSRGLSPFPARLPIVSISWRHQRSWNAFQGGSISGGGLRPLKRR